MKIRDPYSDGHDRTIPASQVQSMLGKERDALGDNGVSSIADRIAHKRAKK